MSFQKKFVHLNLWGSDLNQVTVINITNDRPIDNMYPLRWGAGKDTTSLLWYFSPKKANLVLIMRKKKYTKQTQIEGQSRE